MAYASVAMTGIDRSAAPEVVAKGAPNPVPALLLGRLAVDHRYANLGIGTALTAHVLATAVELNHLDERVQMGTNGQSGQRWRDLRRCLRIEAASSVASSRGHHDRAEL